MRPAYGEQVFKFLQIPASKALAFDYFLDGGSLPGIFLGSGSGLGVLPGGVVSGALVGSMAIGMSIS